MKKILLFLWILSFSYSFAFANNGVWHFAEDIRPGIFGADENNNSNYTFDNSVEMKKNLYVNKIIDSDVGIIRDDNGGWIRTYGNTGWYSQTYGGGWHMTDSTWIRTINNKSIYSEGKIESKIDIKSPIFYDSDNTNYFVNPNAVSKFKNIIVKDEPTTPNNVATKNYVDNKISNSNIKIITGSISNGDNIRNKIPSGYSGWNWKWIVSLRDCMGNRLNGDYEQAENHFQIYLSSNTVIARGRTYNFKHGRYGSWRSCTANYMGIGYP